MLICCFLDVCFIWVLVDVVALGSRARLCGLCLRSYLFAWFEIWYLIVLSMFLLGLCLGFGLDLIWCFCCLGCYVWLCWLRVSCKVFAFW